MNFATPSEMIDNYGAISIKKSKMSFGKMIVLSILAGMLIAFAGAVTNTATTGIEAAGSIRMISGLLFPFGLCMVILSGAELFTGNCLMTIGLLDKKIDICGMLRNLIVVYIGNFVGALIVSYGMAMFGPCSVGSGAVAITSIKLSISKCSMPFANALVQGIFCNMMVCLAVFFSLSAKDVIGRVLGAYIPVCFFVTLGLNHSIADMYYGTVGIFASYNPSYSELISQASIDISKLSWSSYFLGNMIPVTIGNIIGGMLVAIVLWYAHKQK